MPVDELNELCGDLPTIIVGRQIPNTHCIYTDNIDGGYLATKLLIEHGHREIAFIRGIAHHPDVIDRFQGYKNALHEAGIELNFCYFWFSLPTTHLSILPLHLAWHPEIQQIETG